MTAFPIVQATWFTEVSLGAIANNGDHAFSDRNRAKTGGRRLAWENSLGTRLSWRLPQEKAAVTPKPATFDHLGEIRMENRLSWRFPMKKRRLRQNPRAARGNSQWNPFIMAITL